MRRPQHIAAGVEYDIRQRDTRRFLCRPLPEPDQRLLGKLKLRQDADLLAQLPERFDAALAPRGRLARLARERKPRHHEKEARIDAIVAGLDAFTAQRAGLGPFLGLGRSL